ncbi:hypothetical protein Agabi119p4_4448 [Agaricus bisporus var. burnettii]|uniref:Mid2 domain-containing protein n=1 Tax=Agaricus bisporus var. burnettii TaxID=192524 RepID=A0A8H7KHB7_AGABI|nr:hypothetical protein Agabi119p4_4448 [Agaricus bisporus var. burnettii]
MAVYVRRQLIPDVLSDLLPLPTPQPTTTTTSAGLTTTSSSSVVVSSDSAQTSLTASSTSDASSTASSTVSTSIQTSSAVVSSASTSSTTPIVAPTTTAAPTTSVGPSTQFVTSFTTPSPSPTASVQTADNSSSGFLQNKTLTSVVFSIVGVVLLIIIVTIVTMAFRRSRRKRLLNEAVSFDPAYLSGNSNINSTEKRRFSLLSSNSGHGRMHNGNYGATLEYCQRNLCGPLAFSPFQIPNACASVYTSRSFCHRSLLQVNPVVLVPDTPGE